MFAGLDGFCLQAATTNDELESVCDLKKVKSLADTMMSTDDKDNENLAYNTSLLVYGVYGLRTKNNEIGTVSEYGLKTWWMTNQTRVLRHTHSVVREEKRSQYIMTPRIHIEFYCHVT